MVDEQPRVAFAANHPQSLSRQHLQLADAEILLPQLNVIHARRRRSANRLQ